MHRSLFAPLFLNLPDIHKHTAFTHRRIYDIINNKIHSSQQPSHMSISVQKQLNFSDCTVHSTEWIVCGKDDFSLSRNDVHDQINCELWSRRPVVPVKAPVPRSLTHSHKQHSGQRKWARHGMRMNQLKTFHINEQTFACLKYKQTAVSQRLKKRQINPDA